ncbi:calcium channel-like protein subunit Cch1 [Hortaea werneckii]|nr:calcium channel-like protein subunit Cch1 [Hortaea werneckii]
MRAFFLASIARLNRRAQYSVSKKPTTMLRLTASSTRCRRARRRKNSSSFKLLLSLMTLRLLSLPMSTSMLPCAPSSGSVEVAVDSHFKDTGKFTQEPWKDVFRDVAGSVRAAAPLVDVREALVDERDKQIDENVHAQNVPGNEQRSCPFWTAAIAVEVAVTGRAKRQDQCFWHGTHIDVARLVTIEPSKTKGLSQCDSIHQEQDKPGGKQVCNGGERSGSRLEELIQLIVPWDQQECDRDQEQLMQLAVVAVRKVREHKQSGDECSGDCKNRIHVPGAFPKSSP